MKDARGCWGSAKSPYRVLTTRADVWALLTLVVLVLVFAAPLFAHPGRMRDPENGDTLNYYLHLELARRSIIGYGQFPWWTPYVRGGIPLVGHPRDVSLSPVVVPALILGPIPAVKVICLGVYLAAAVGMFYLTRVVLRLSRAGSVAASVLFVTAVWLPARLVSGNYDEWHLVLFPLVLAFYYRSREHWRYLIYGAMVLYVTIIDGKYVIVLFGLYLGLIAGAELVHSALRRRPTLLPLGRLAAMFALAALLATVKIVPMTQLMRGGKAALESPIVEPAEHLSLVARLGVRPFDPGDPTFGTRVADLGTWFAAPLLCVLALAAVPRRMLGWMALLALSLLLMNSRAVPRWMDLFGLLHRLPVFSAIRKPFKYFNFFALFAICLGVAHAVTFVCRWGLVGRAAAVVLALLTGAVPFVWHVRLNAHIFSAQPEDPKVVRADGFYSVAAFDGSEHGQQYRMFKDFFFVREGVGVLNWYDPLNLPCRVVPRYRVERSPKRPVRYDYAENAPPWRGEVYLAGGGRAGIRRGTWSPLALTVDFEVPLAAEDTLVVNRNYNRRWRASAGEVVNHQGLLAVRLPAGTADVRLRYRPTDHYLAALLSAVAWLACVAALILDRRRRKPRARPEAIRPST